MKITDNGAVHGVDCTAAILATLKKDRIVEFPLGDWLVDGKQLFNGYIDTFCFRGYTPITTWQHEIQEVSPRQRGARIIIKNLPPDKPWVDIRTPLGKRGGPYVIENLSIFRETSSYGGAVLSFKGEFPVNVTECASRGLLIRNSSFHCISPLWTRDFRSEILPQTPPAIYLSDCYDANLERVSCWGFETQLHFENCDRLRVRDWHGGNCARSIVSPGGMVQSIIDGAHIENVVISGIDVSAAAVTNSNVEVGYFAKVGRSTLPDTIDWSLSGEKVKLSDDARKWIAPNSVVMLTEAFPIYVTTVDSSGFNWYQSNAHAKLPDMNGTGKDLIRLFGVPYVLRGEATRLSGWMANLNVPLKNLPVAALFPFRSPIIVNGVDRASDQTWDQNNHAIVSGWAEQQWNFWGGIHWSGSAFRPNHPWVYGENTPKFDPNKRWEI